LCSPGEIICRLTHQKDGGRCKSEDLGWRTEDRSLQAVDVQDKFKPALDRNCQLRSKKKTREGFQNTGKSGRKKGIAAKTEILREHPDR